MAARTVVGREEKAKQKATTSVVPILTVTALRTVTKSKLMRRVTPAVATATALVLAPLPLDSPIPSRRRHRSGFGVVHPDVVCTLFRKSDAVSRRGSSTSKQAPASAVGSTSSLPSPRASTLTMTVTESTKMLAKAAIKSMVNNIKTIETEGTTKMAARVHERAAKPRWQ